MKTIKLSLLTAALAFIGIGSALAQKCDMASCAASKSGISYNSSKSSNSVVLDKPAAEVWATFAKIDGLEEVVPTLLASTRITGDGMAKEGCTRICTSPDGQLFEEKITSLDNKNMFYAYQIVEGVPAKMVNSFQVVSLGDNKCKVVWSSRYEYMQNDMISEADFAVWMKDTSNTIMSELKSYFS